MIFFIFWDIQIFWPFLNFFLIFGDNYEFLDFFSSFLWIFFLFFFWILFKVTKDTTESYQGYYWAPTIAKNGLKLHNKLSKKASAEGQSPSQELEVGHNF